jgi:hypothetical protein
MRRVVAIMCIAVLGGGLVLGLSGCDDDGDSTTLASTAPTATTQDEANAAFCSSLVDVQAALTDVKNLDPDTVSVSSLTSTVTSLTTTLSQLTAGATEAVGLDSSELQNAFSQLTADLTAIPGSGQGLSTGLTAASAAVEPGEDALDEVKPECSTDGTTTG